MSEGRIFKCDNCDYTGTDGQAAIKHRKDAGHGIYAVATVQDEREREERLREDRAAEAASMESAFPGHGEAPRIKAVTFTHPGTGEPVTAELSPEMSEAFSRGTVGGFSYVESKAHPGVVWPL